MARAYPAPPTAEYGAQPSTGDWQALRGELVALLDQVEGQYADTPANPALEGFAQRVRDLRYQVTDNGDDRRREALRSVKRQIERFNDRGEPETIPHADNVLQSAIQQIRARTQAPVAPPRQMTAPPAIPYAPPMPEPTPRFDALAHSMAGLSERLGQIEGELKTQRGNAGQVKEIADQVAQLSHVVELLAGAVGETGQVKRLEAQIAGLAQMVQQAPRPDLSQLTERLDLVVATVDRLADLQVQQIRHVVEEAETQPARDSETVLGLKAIEGSVRNIYDRIDALENSSRVTPDQLERISQAVAHITAKLEGDGPARPERLLSLVDALNGRINEIEDHGDSLGGLRGDIEGLRSAVLGAIEPRFVSIENQLGALGERLAAAPAIDVPGVAQLEAQVRQLVARMDQTSEQLGELARLYNAADDRAPLPDLEALANLAATRSFEAMQRQQPVPPPVPDFEALAALAASKASAAVRADTPPPPPPAPLDLSESNLAAIEQRLSHLVERMTQTRPPEGASGMQQGIERVEDRLARLEAALTRRETAATPPHLPASPLPPPSSAPALSPQPTPPPVATPPAPQPRQEAARDAMPRVPSDEAPLRDFGFPDLSPVREALEAKNGPRRPQPAPSADEARPVGGSRRPAAEPPVASFNPATVERPARPVSSLESVAPAAQDAPEPLPQRETVVPASTRNTFIEAARRQAQRQTTPRGEGSSVIGKAFARLQPGSKPAAPEPAASAVPAGKPVPEPKRAEKPASAPKPVRLPEPAPDLAPSAVPSSEQLQESWLSRYRRPILLGASLVAISFMALNLVAQRLTADQPPSTAANTAAPAPATVPLAPPAQPAIKPTSELPDPPANASAPASPATDVAATSGPRLTSMTDPMTTASINPGASMAFAPVTSSEVMPPPVAATNAALAPAAPAIAAPTADASASATPATDPGSAAAAPAGSDIAATATAADPAAAAPAGGQPAPVALASIAPDAPASLESPVKVEMPPEGIGPQDLRQAAADGDARAQFEIAAIYSEGRAVPQDYKQAEVWYERAAAQGFGPAQYRLGNLYENGKGVTKDLEQARLWYQRAAEAGNRMAMHNLAALYASGQFGKQDFASAAEWFERAADLGMKDSQFNLGMLYARGLGVQQSLETSYKWFALAATGGDAEAEKARDNVARSLDADAVKRAGAAVAAFKLGPVNLAANFAPIGTWEKDFNPGPTVSNKDVVQKVQVALMRLGFDVGTPDGHAGPKTADAIKAFEHSTGMTEVGLINPRLLAVLGSQPV